MSVNQRWMNSTRSSCTRRRTSCRRVGSLVARDFRSTIAMRYLLKTHRPRTSPSEAPSPPYVRSLLDAELLGQQLEIAALVLRELVAPMVGELKLGGDTPDASPLDPPLASKPFGGIAAQAAVSQGLPPVPADVDRKRMEVDLASARVAQDEPRRQPRPCAR